MGLTKILCERKLEVDIYVIGSRKRQELRGRNGYGKSVLTGIL